MKASSEIDNHQGKKPAKGKAANELWYQQSIHVWLAMCSGGIIADDWASVHWHKIEYLMTCGLEPWYSNHTDIGQTPPLPPQQLVATMSPEAPHVLAQLRQQQNQPQAGQQQAWVYPGPSAEPNQATVPQLWPNQPGGGAVSGGGVQAVAKVGQPWQSSPGRWQCDVNITLINQGDLYRFCSVMASSYLAHHELESTIIIIITNVIIRVIVMAS